MERLLPWSVPIDLVGVVLGHEEARVAVGCPGGFWWWSYPRQLLADSRHKTRCRKSTRKLMNERNGVIGGGSGLVNTRQDKGRYLSCSQPNPAQQSTMERTSTVPGVECETARPRLALMRGSDVCAVIFACLLARFGLVLGHTLGHHPPMAASSTRCRTAARLMPCLAVSASCQDSMFLSSQALLSAQKIPKYHPVEWSGASDARRGLIPE